MKEVTRILSTVEQGDPSAAERLLPLVYDELRRLAAQKLAREKPGQSLEATALVHEAYLRLVDVEQAQHWNSRGHFFGACAEAMRRILVDNARRKSRKKHGGAMRKVEMVDVAADADDKLLDLDEALTRLAKENPHAAEVFKLRYFAGLSHEQVAEVMRVSKDKAREDWAFAKAWLTDALDLA